MTVKELAEKLRYKSWRLNNIYTIYTKDNQRQKLKLNHGQQKVLNIKHNRKIILKTRQQGISTLFVMYNLDSVMTIPGYTAGIQSYGKDEATKLAKKAHITLEYMHPAVKQLLGIKLTSRSKENLEFSNNGNLRIGNFRGSTLQSLHISELAKIAKKYPDKAQELKTGAFQSVSPENKITIESTAEGKEGLFYEMWEQAVRRFSINTGKVFNYSDTTDYSNTFSPLDFYPIFLSWIDDLDCNIDTPYPTGNVESYFEELEQKHGIVLKDTQKWWYAAKYDELGRDIYQEYPTLPEEAFQANIHGTYFEANYARLIRDRRITKVEYNRRYPVYAAFDLGVNDNTVIIFAQIIQGKVYIIEEYINNGKDIAYYVEILKSMNFSYKRIFLPHDAQVRELSGRTRLETFKSLGVHQAVILRPKLSFADSIQTARSFLNDDIYISERCVNLIAALQNYRKKYDEKLKVYLPTDVHDKHSDVAAALRYLAQGIKKAMLNEQKTFKKTQKDFAI